MKRSVEGLTREEQYKQQEQLLDRWKNNKALFTKQCLGGQYRKMKLFQSRMLQHRGAVKLGRHISLRLLPRDSGKSWMGTIADSIHEICTDPNTAMQYIAEAQETAVMFLAETKQHLESNTTIHEFYGNPAANTRTWSAKRIVSGLRTTPRKEPTIETFGAGGAIVGRHVNRQYMDDLVSNRTSDTTTKRQKLEDWYDKMALPVLEQGGTQCINGTRYFPGDLYEMLIKRYGADILYRVYALTQVPGSDGSPEYKSYFPERYPVEVLLEIRKSNPIVFASQYQNEIDLMMSNILNHNALHVVERSDMPPFNEMVFYIGVDPATGLKTSHDYFAVVTVGYHAATNRKYVVRSSRSKLGDPESMLRQIVREWRWVVEQGGSVASIAIESNSFQSVLAKTAYADPARFGMLPVIPVYTLKDKVQRLIAQAHHYNLGQVYFDEECYQLVEELAAFPKVKNDDTVDALMIAMQSIEETQQESSPFKVDTMDIATTSHVLTSPGSKSGRADKRPGDVTGHTSMEF